MATKHLVTQQNIDFIKYTLLEIKNYVMRHSRKTFTDIQKKMDSL